MELNSLISKMKYRICELVSTSKEGHILSSLSSLDIIYAIFSGVLRKSEVNTNYPFKDFFILSKGHAALALYVVLEELGYIDTFELNSFCETESIFGGHPDATKVNLALASTGSLGHGFPISVGIAYSQKLKISDSQILCLIGDGESMEGTLWEALHLVNHLDLKNITLLVDFNSSHQMGPTKNQLLETFKSFGWKTLITNGHDTDNITRILNLNRASRLFVILETIRGNGIKLIEGNSQWHHKVPTSEDLSIIREQLKI